MSERITFVFIPPNGITAYVDNGDEQEGLGKSQLIFVMLLSTQPHYIVTSLTQGEQNRYLTHHTHSS